MLQLLKDVDKLSNNAPIGVFDSGLGGLTVWREVRRALPAESLVYLGDGKNCPYGSRPREEVRRLADEAVASLVAQGCKMVVVACNTATAAAIDFLREKYAPMPIVGMEPAVKPACLATRSGVVGVLATERSLDGELFRRTAARYGDGVDLVTAPGRGFVELVENDLEATPEAEATVRAAVAEMLEHGADQIVLGCTHYPMLAAAIRKVVGELYGEDAAKALTVQYGGSMNPKNAEELLSKPDVDGGLIGGASLKADQFAVIVDAATKG